MSLAKQILGQIVADHGGMSHATADRIGRITKNYMDRIDLLADLVNLIGDWQMFTSGEKSDFSNKAKKEWNPRNGD